MTTIDASSEPNGAEQKDKTEPTKSKPLVKPKLALVVDEHRGNRLRLEVRLLSAGVRSKTFSSGDAAMKALLAGEVDMPDVIIVGEKTPHIEGLQVIKYIKRLPAAAKIPQLHYCIKEGELCVVQARTFGAVGADAEEFDAVDLDEVLSHLNLSERLRKVSVEGEAGAYAKTCTLKMLASEVDAHLDEMNVVADSQGREDAGETSSVDNTPSTEKASGDRADLVDAAAVGDIEDEGSNALGDLVDECSMQHTSDDTGSPRVGESSQSCDAENAPGAEPAACEESDESGTKDELGSHLLDEEHAIDGLVEVEDPFAEKPHRRLVDSKSLKGLISASASNDAESFREHSSVVAYLRSLERKSRRTPAARRNSDLWREKRRQQRESSETEGSGWRDALTSESRVTNNRLLGLESQRLEFQERLDRSIESLQHQFEFELMRQTGTLQESVSEMMEAHAETIRDQLLTAGHHQRLDRWLRIMVIVSLLLMPSMWLISQPQPAAEPTHSLNGDVMEPTASSNKANRDAPSTEAVAAIGLSDAERDRVAQAVEQLLNAGAAPEFGTTALGLREAARLEQALDMLMVVDFRGLVQVINHVSPYCVQYDDSGKAFLDESLEAVSQCFMSPDNIVAAESQAADQSVEFGNLLSRYNRPDVPIKVAVVPQVSEADYWSVSDTFEPSATGEKLTASDWNDRARLRNRVEYRVIAQTTSPSQ